MDSNCRSLWTKAWHLNHIKELVEQSQSSKFALPIIPDSEFHNDKTIEEINEEINERYPTPDKNLTYQSFKEVIFFRGLTPPLAYHLFALKDCVAKWKKVGNKRIIDELFHRNLYFAMWLDFDPDTMLWAPTIGYCPLEKNCVDHLRKIGADETNIKNCEEDPAMQSRWDELLNKIRKIPNCTFKIQGESSTPPEIITPECLSITAS